MIYPKKVENGDIIEIISPSDGVRLEKINKYENALNNLEKFGFRIIEDKYVRYSKNGASSSANNRSAQLNKAISDKNVKALIACSGGDYLVQILDFINFSVIKKNIKWIQGHSDITPLLFYITTKFDIATIYSFNVKTFGDDSLPRVMINNSIDVLKGKNPKQIEYGYKFDEEKIEQPWQCITYEKALTGRVIGGCLDSLKDIIGTKYDCANDFVNKYLSDGIIWYFDVFDMSNEDILRTMWQFKNAGWFIGCKGILFGRIENEINYTGLSLKDAINYNLNELNVPIFINTDIGHTDPVHTLINGSKIKITKNEDNKHVLETIFE